MATTFPTDDSYLEVHIQLITVMPDNHGPGNPLTGKGKLHHSQIQVRKRNGR